MKENYAYYAHSMRKYNTPIEKEEFAFIEECFKGLVICPNKHIGDLGRIEPYLNVVESSCAVFASEYQNCIGWGVYTECTFALERKIPVYLIRKDENNQYKVLMVTGVEKKLNATPVLYGRLVTK
jgi:hypothetical protein